MGLWLAVQEQSGACDDSWARLGGCPAWFKGPEQDQYIPLGFAFLMPWEIRKEYSNPKPFPLKVWRMQRETIQVLATSVDSGAKLLQFKSQLCSLPVMRTWASYLTVKCLNLLNGSDKVPALGYFPGSLVVKTAFQCRGCRFHPIIRELRSPTSQGKKQKHKIEEILLTNSIKTQNSPH